jgi:transcriptional regulator with XRE-family HTH domain
MNPREFGLQVQRLRKDAGMSQMDLANKADLSRNYVSIIERGDAQNVSMNIVSQIAVALGTTPATLIGESASAEQFIPPGLRQMALAEGLSYDTVDRLARLPRRGQEPKTVEEWRQLYRSIRDYL